MPDSPRPSANRAMAKPETLPANAWPAAASDQTISDDRIAEPRAELVHHPAGEEEADGVGELERGVDVAELRGASSR